MSESALWSKWMSKIITLTTDFGLTDEYVGVMKGVILSRAPQAKFVDLSHSIDHQDIHQAAYIIESAYKYFPAGTLHVLVIDPGVGTNRRIILVDVENQLFVAPDNGTLTLVLEGKVFTAYAVTCEHLFLKPTSHTFHGRDIFAPVAAALINGMKPDEVGPKMQPEELTILDLPKAKIDTANNSITGAVAYIDHFGNLITNIHRDTFSQLFTNAKQEILISVKDQTIRKIQNNYASVDPRSIVAIFGSRGYLEIVTNHANASQVLDISINDRVLIQGGN